MDKILSLCMIVKNEEANLDRLLTCCAGVFDEIIITDTGSEDKTKEVAAKHGAVISDFKWVKDFAKARNFSFSQATCPWRMWLDADDYIQVPDRDKLLALKKELPTLSANAIKLLYRYNPEITGYNYRVVRNRPDILWKYPAHESLIGPFENHVSREILIEHWGGWKPGRDMDILKTACEGEWKDDGRMWFYYIREYSYRHDYEKVVELYRSHLHLVPWYTRFGAYYFYAEACFKTGRGLKGVDLCMEALRQNPGYGDFYCLLGEYYMELENYYEAKRWYEKALTTPYPVNTSEVFMCKNNYGFEPRRRLKAIEKVLRAELI